MRLTPAGQSAARSVLPAKADLGSASDWKGGAVKPEITDADCANYNPKRSDLVTIGEAAVSYVNAGVTMRTESQVFATPKMARLDWQRTVRSRSFLACQRTLARKNLTGANRFVSLERLTVPNIGTETAGLRLTLDATRKGKTVRVIVDQIGFVHGNVSVGLMTIMSELDVEAMWPNELVLAKTIAGRVRS